MSNRFESIITDYNAALSTDGHIELEAKIQDLDSATFLSSLRGLPKNVTPLSIECSISNITNRSDERGSYSYIESTYYDDNARVSEECQTKRLLGAKFTSRDSMLKYTVAISSEKSIEKNPSWNTFGTFVRAKLRASFVSDSSSIDSSSGKGWRYDYTITITKQRYDIGPGVITGIRQRLFDGVKCSDISHDKIVTIFSERAIHPDVSFELEVERLSQTRLEDRREIDEAISVIWRSLGSSGDDERVSLIREVFESISRNPSQGKMTLKTILNAAKSLTKSDYYANIYPPLGWYVTDKADGERAVIYVRGNEGFIISRELMKFAMPAGSPRMIADCELISLPGGGRLLGVFDVMIYNDEVITLRGIEDRMVKAPDVVKATTLPLSAIGVTIFAKEYLQISQPIEETINITINRKRAYKTDGLIITSQGSDYYTTRNLKWKPSHENTIDFMAIRLPETMKGLISSIEGHETYILLVGMNDQRRRLLGVRQWSTFEADTGISLGQGYQPCLYKSAIWPMTYIYRAPSGTPDIHRRVVEMAVDDGAAKLLRSAFEEGRVTSDLNIWKFMRIREDRSPSAGEYGNDYDIAESVFSNIIDPFQLSDLSSSNGGGYFEKSRDIIYKASNKFKRFVIKKTFLEHIHEGDIVLDLAAGRGADLPTYNEIGVSKLIAVDIDPTALVELHRRSLDKHITDQRKPKDNSHSNRKETRSMSTHIIVTNVGGNSNVNRRAIVDRFGIETANVIVCNFALHYMCKNATQCTNFFALARDFAIDTAGHESRMIVTIMNGGKVFELLADYKPGETWISSDDEKYAIRRDYDDDELKKFGQMIAVKLPMTTKMYEEPLANIAAITDVAETTGWRLESSKPFSDYMSAYAASATDALSPEDIKYGGMHQVLVFVFRTKKVTGGRWKK